MGVYYTQYLVPKIESIAYHPDIPTLEAMIRRLVALQWIDAAWRRVPVAGVNHASHATPRGLAEDLSVFQSLGGPWVLGPFPAPPPEVFWGGDRVRADGLCRAYDFRDSSDGIFQAGYNDELRLIVTDVPSLVSTNAYFETRPEQEPCARCGAGLVRPVSEIYADQPERGSWFESHCANLVLPVPCSACGADVDLVRLGHLPLFRFAVQLDPPAKCTPGVGDGFPDPTLLDALHEVTGVEFDMIPSWS